MNLPTSPASGTKYSSDRAWGLAATLGRGDHDWAYAAVTDGAGRFLVEITEIETGEVVGYWRDR